MNELDFDSKIEDLKKRKGYTEKREGQFRADYVEAKEQLAKELIQEGFYSGKTFSLNLEKRELSYHTDRPLNTKITKLLSLGSTAYSRDYIRDVINLNVAAKRNAIIKIYKYHILIDFPYKINEVDFKYLLRVLGITSVYYDSFAFEKIERTYNFGKLALEVFTKSKIKIHKR